MAKYKTVNQLTLRIKMNYGNLAQTGAVMAPTAFVATGSWVAVAAVAGIVGVLAIVKLVTPSAEARP